MATYAVTRHESAIAWLSQMGTKARQVTDADEVFFSRLGPDDVVIGNLPAPMIAELNRSGVQYKHISFKSSPRANELSLEEMHASGAHLVDVCAWVPNNKPIPRITSATRGYFPIILLIFALVLSAFFVNLAAGQVSLALDVDFELRPNHILLGVLFLCFACGLGLLVWRFKGQFVEFSSVQLPDLPAHRAVVFGLSPITLKEGQTCETIGQSLRNIGLDRLLLPTPQFEALKEDAEIGGDVSYVLRNPWHHTIRMLASQRQRAELAICLTSQGADGSDDQFEDFERTVVQIFADAGQSFAISKHAGGPIDFFDHGAVRLATLRAVKDAMLVLGVRSHEIAVDVTAGPKLFTFAAAGATTTSDTKMLYVNNDGSVLAFDSIAALGEAS